MSELRDIAIIAGHELLEAVRSRRVLVFFLLYVGGAAAGTVIFADTLASLEAGLADALGATAPDRPGAVTRELMRSPEFVRVLTRLVRDRDLALELAGLPPLSLFYGWLALSFTPVLVMLTASEAVAGDLATGAIRFSLLRTTRLSFSVGKLVGHTLLMSLSLTTGALAVWVTGYFSLSSFEAGRSALWLLWLSSRAWLYGFSHVGLALGLSHLTRSVHYARALGLLSLGALGGLWALSQKAWAQQNPALADSLAALLPRAHQLSLWRPELALRAPALVMLAALGVFYFSLGYRYRARRDA